MLDYHLLCAFASLLHLATAQDIQYELVNTVVIPKVKNDFAKNNVTAQWAASYPKEWGSEDFQYQFTDPDPNDIFSATVSDNEKYLAMFNGTHAKFIDLSTNSTISVLNMGVPTTIVAYSLTFRSSSHDQYDVLINGGRSKYDTPNTIIRWRLGSDLQPLGDSIIYEGGVGSISKQGKLATTSGYVYDLESTNTSAVILDGQPRISDMSFSPDGVHLSTVSWQDETADLWNATSGEKIFTFPPTKAQNWVTRFSPNGKYIAIGLGSNNNTVQIYTLENLSAKPAEIKGFNTWPRTIEWSQDMKYIATGDVGRMRVWRVPELELAQTWEVSASGNGVYELSGVAWVDGGNKLTFEFRDGRFLYDFENNIKWWWSPRVLDHLWNGSGLSFLKKMGYVVTEDGDSIVRFWKV